MSIEIETADARDGFALHDEHIVWSGPLDASIDDAPCVRVTVRRDDPAGEALARAVQTGDALAADTVVRTLAMPAGMLDALAAHCLSHDRETALFMASGRGAPDPRWTRALDSANPQNVASPELAWTDPPIAIDPGTDRFVTSLRVLSEERVAAVAVNRFAGVDTSARVFVGTMNALQSLELAVREKAIFALLEPAHAPHDVLMVAGWEPSIERVTAWHITLDGAVIETWRTRLNSTPRHVSIMGDTVCVHAEHSHVWIGPEHVVRDDRAETLPPRQSIARGDADYVSGMARVGERGLVFAPRVLIKDKGWRPSHYGWVDLASGESGPWNACTHDLGSIAAAFGAVWVTSEEGLFELRPDAAPRRVLGELVTGLAIDSRTVWVGTRNELIEIEPTSGSVLRRIAIGHGCYRILVAPGGLVVDSNFRFSWVDRSGNIVFTSHERRDVGRALLADGTCVVSASEDVLIAAADGSIRRRLALPYDGQIVGATATHALFGQVSGGIAQVAADGLYAIDADGRITDRVRFEGGMSPMQPRSARHSDVTPARPDGVSLKAAWLLDGAGRVHHWKPLVAQTDRSALPTRRIIERSVTVLKHDTVNPRDDWPEPGLDVNGAAFVSIGSRYGGTTGYCAERAVRITSSSVATLIRCTLDHGGGAIVQQGSTLILHGCRLGTARMTLESGCHLLMIDCELSGPFEIEAAPGASVCAPGLKLTERWRSSAGVFWTCS